MLHCFNTTRESVNRLVQLKESCTRLSLLKSPLFFQVTCLSLELTRKMHSLAAVLQKKKVNTWSPSSSPLGFCVHFCDSALGRVGTVKDAQLPKMFVILCPCQTASLLWLRLNFKSDYENILVVHYFNISFSSKRWKWHTSVYTEGEQSLIPDYTALMQQTWSFHVFSSFNFINSSLPLKCLWVSVFL